MKVAGNKKYNHEDYFVCIDCLMGIANDDYSGLDYYLNNEESIKREEHIRNSIFSIQSSYNNFASIHAGNSDKDEEFSNDSCDCCGNCLAGSRHHCVVLF
jgi:hypothetical protein